MKKYAVITGASSGIGVEFAKEFAKRGYALILTARRKERLEKLAERLPVACKLIAADLEKEEECYRFFREIEKLPIEVFINNAGFGCWGRFTDTGLERELSMIRVNVEAVHILTKLALKNMQRQGRGYILNVASSAGLIPAGPYMGTYYATKAYVTSLTRAIAAEQSQMHSRIYVGCLCPGPVDTEFNDVADVTFSLKGISASRCVKYAVRQMWRRKTVIVPTLPMKFVTTCGRFLPQELFIKMTGRQQKKKGTAK